jgi:hypothetical protein
VTGDDGDDLTYLQTRLKYYRVLTVATSFPIHIIIIIIIIINGSTALDGPWPPLEVS